MKGFVLDAGVAAKWFLPGDGEPNAAEAAELLEAYRQGTVDLSVPDLFWPEFANILWKSQRLGRIDRNTATKAIGLLTATTLKTYPSRTLLPGAWKVACAFDRAVCDAVYVALAVEIGRPLITADEKLVNALAARFRVRWLGIWAAHP